MHYMLDTNICIYIAKHNPPSVRARFERLARRLPKNAHRSILNALAALVSAAEGL